MGPEQVDLQTRWIQERMEAIWDDISQDPNTATPWRTRARCQRGAEPDVQRTASEALWTYITD